SSSPQRSSGSPLRTSLAYLRAPKTPMLSASHPAPGRHTRWQSGTSYVTVSHRSVRACNAWCLPNASEANERGARCWLGAYLADLVEAVSADEVVVPPKGDC